MSDAGPGKLAGIAFLADLSAEELARLEKACAWQRHKAGEQILDRHSDSRDVFFVVEGLVQVVNFSSSGREVAYAEVKAGGFFGELSAIDGEPRSATVVAVEPVLLAALQPSYFIDMLSRNPGIGVHVLQRLARIIRISDERIMDLATLGAVQRVVVELLRMARPDPVKKGAWIIYPMPTQASIASKASTTRETVARVLGQIEGMGLIRRQARNTFIDDRQKLERYAERLGANHHEGVR